MLAGLWMLLLGCRSLRSGLSGTRLRSEGVWMTSTGLEMSCEGMDDKSLAGAETNFLFESKRVETFRR
jgi:hypothetical protein